MKTFAHFLRSSPISGMNPMMSLEEREVIEEASRRVGKSPVEFMKDAGLALAVSILDGGLSTTGNGSGLAGVGSGIVGGNGNKTPHRHIHGGANPPHHRGLRLGRKRPGDLGS